MKIVIAPDSFKESLSAMQVASAIEAGFRDIYPDAVYQKIPLADGGEGTVQAMIDALGGRRLSVTARGPLGQAVDAFYGLVKNDSIAVIEMAAASGLELITPAQRDPLLATSYGTGELIRAALDAGARHLVLGVGGTACNDGGAGLLQALGVRMLDRDGAEIGMGGAELARLASIDSSGLDPRIGLCVVDVACDVDNPLLGPTGASAIFGPQKGATPAMVDTLDTNLRRYADAIVRATGIDLAERPGAGAGGGAAAAMMGFLGGRLRPGSEIVNEATGLDAALRDADLVITGEGRIDSQTIHGKTPIGVARAARLHNVPVIGIGGCLSPTAAVVHEHGIAAIFGAVSRPCQVEEALRDATTNLRAAARNVAATLKIGQSLPHTRGQV